MREFSVGRLPPGSWLPDSARSVSKKSETSSLTSKVLLPITIYWAEQARGVFYATGTARPPNRHESPVELGCMKRPVMILVVEDEADAARLLQYHLQRHGYRTRVATDGRTALNIALTERPDLVVLDLMLPHLDGFELCRLLRAAPVTATVPIVMVTARSDTTDRLKGFRLGADDYVTKPYEMAELLARVQRLLRRPPGPSLLTQFTDL